MSDKPGIWFVYRSHYEGPLGKRVRRIEAPSVLAWFQAQIEEARVVADPGESALRDVGGRVYGFQTVFEAARKHSLHTPRSTAALRKLLGEHLYVEGGEEHILADSHSLRVLTDDDEVTLAYFFFDEDLARRSPDRVAWLLHEELRLPEGDVDGGFRPPVEVAPLTPAGAGEGATYACLLTFYDGESLPGTAHVFPGVRLPGLAAHLRATIPDAAPAKGSGEYLETWPVEIRLLRAMLDEGDATVGPALGRAATYPLGEVAAGNTTRLGTGPFAAARADFLAAAEGRQHRGDPAKSIVHESAHAALLAAHTSAHFGYQQWVFFDDRWAAAQPYLAASLLHYATHWDPFEPVRAPKPPREAKPPKEQKPSKEQKAGTKPRAPASTAKAKASAAAARHEDAFQGALAGRGEDAARAYSPAERFGEGDLIKHGKFGLGVVSRVEGAKIEAIFADAPRVLVHAAR